VVASDSHRRDYLVRIVRARRAHDLVDEEDDHPHYHRQRPDGAVLALEERLRAFLDGVGDGAHLRCAVVHLEHPACQADGDEERQDAHGEDEADDHGYPRRTGSGFRLPRAA